MSARIESLDTSAEERSGHVVKVNGKHRIEGHMGLLREIFESVREFDPSIGPDMPAHYLDPVSISQLFGLPLEEVAPWALEKRDSEAGFSEDDRRDLRTTKALVENLLSRDTTDSILEHVAADRAAIKESLQAVQKGVEAIAVVDGQQNAAKEWFSPDEVAQQLEKAPFTVREWCRLGRVNACKRQTGRGDAKEWEISHVEVERIRNHGLLPLCTKY